MRRGWQLASLGFLALFLFAIWKATSLPLQDALGPGPGFFPLWLGIIGSVLAVALIAEVTRQKEMGPSAAELLPDRGALFRILAVLVMLAAVAAAFDVAGFRLTAFAFTALLLPMLGATRPWIVLPFALFSSIGVFHVFYYWLKVPLPIGPFDHLLKPLGL